MNRLVELVFGPLLAVHQWLYEQSDGRIGASLGVQPGAELITGVGNFVLCHLPRDAPDAAEVVRRCRARDVYVRDVGGMGRELGTHALRVAVKEIEAQQRILAALAEALVS
jgi:histidinol-phosphate/aromatic aminotransferase/cobyric acid decarboxylase-like protein